MMPTPAFPATEVARDDATDLPSPTIALAVASPGTVRITAIDGSVGDVTIAPGQAFPLRIIRVWATGTSVTGIVGSFRAARPAAGAFPERPQRGTGIAFRRGTALPAGADVAL